MTRRGERRGERHHVTNFFRRVDRSGDCWEWVGAKDRQGYGKVQFGRSSHLAHRVSHAWRHGIPLEELNTCVLHRCDNPCCVNPDHLFTGSRADNSNDAMMKGRVLRGEQATRAKLTEDDVRAIRASRESALALSRRYPVSDRMIGKIRNRESWTHVP
jgi:hypothetical protein